MNRFSSLVFFSIVIWSAVLNHSFCQIAKNNQSSNTIKLSLNQKLDVKTLDLERVDNITWSILQDNQIITEQINTNKSILDHIWSTPGKFTLLINQAKDDEINCNHHNQLKSFEVEVSSVNVNFLIDQIDYRGILTQRSIKDGIELEIPLEISSYFDTLSFNPNLLKINVNGVNCSVEGLVISQDLITKQGKYNIIFNLKGFVTKGTYIMIDFIDHDGKITTYYHLEQL
jgi:hypothetical protein